MTDIELIKKYVKNKDNKAFETFFNRYKDKLYGFICCRTYPELADDIFQESFKKFINAVFEREINNPKSYLFMITMNVMKNRGREKFKDTISYEDEINYDNKNEYPQDISNFETEFDKETDLLKLDKALKRLSEIKPEFYNILHLHIYSGFSFTDIAEIESLNRNTVTGRFMYAIKHLKKYYSET